MLPAAASFHRQGANKGATSSFLIATPESGVDSIAVTYALLDPLMTVVRPLAAFISAISAGLTENIFFWKGASAEMKLDKSCPVDGCCDGVDCPDEIHRRHHSFYEKVLSGLQFGVKDIWGDIVGWFFIGLILAAFIGVVIPEEAVVDLLGGGLHSMLLMLVVGIPLYICATASTPIAAALILKGVSPGAALVFLLVGPATNLTSLSVLFGILGKRSTFVYLSVLSICAVVAGLATDQLYTLLGISPVAVMGQAGELLPESVKLASALLLLAISVPPLLQFVRRKFGKKQEAVYQCGFPQRLQPVPQPSQPPLARHNHSSSCGCGK